MTEKKHQGVMSPEEAQSQTIDLLRFPLAVMVIYSHIAIEAPVPAQLGATPPLSAADLHYILELILTDLLTKVPVFYFISGLLFFLTMRQWSWLGYKKKMRRRLQALLIPYLMWNITTFFIFVAVQILLKGEPLSYAWAMFAEQNWHVVWDCNEWGTDRVNWLGGSLRTTGPFDTPLWFLRDLMVVSALSPLIYCFIRRTRIYGMALLSLAYISRIWPVATGFSVTAVFFFSLGAYFAINGINVIHFVQRTKYVVIVSFLALLAACIAYNGEHTVIGQNIYPFFAIATVFVSFYAASVFVTRWNVKANKFLVSSCFFVYAFHDSPTGNPLGISNTVLHFVIPGSSALENAVCYLLSPFLAAAICVFILLLLKKFTPRLAKLYSGNR